MSKRAGRGITTLVLAICALQFAAAARAQLAPSAGQGGDTFVQGTLVQLGTPELDLNSGGAYTYPRLNLDAATVTPAPGAAAAGGAIQGFNPYCPPNHQCRGCGLTVFGEFLYLHPRGADVPYGVVQDGLGFPGSAPMGGVGNATIGYKPGFRAGAAIELGQDSQIVGTYTRFTSSDTSSLSASGLNVINPLAAFPGTFNAGFVAQQAQASYSTNFQLVDVEYKSMLYGCDRYWIRGIAGAAYGQFEQDFSVNYPFAPPDGTTNVITNTNFEGAGLVLGLDADRLLFPNRGFSIYARALARFLAGRARATYAQTNQFNGVEATTSFQDYRIVPVTDLEAGVAWTSPRGMFRFSSGYLVSAWFNSLTTPDWIDAVQALNFNGPSGTITFDGLVARGEVRF